MNPDKEDVHNKVDDLRNRTGWHHLKPPYQWPTILVIGAIIVAIIWTGWFPGVPRRLKLAIYAFVPAFVAGYPAATRIVEWLYQPQVTYLVDWNAETDDLAIWELPASSWRDLQVSEGELYSIKAAHPAWEGKNYDSDENTVEGTWRGSATDRELIDSKESIDEIRNDLEDLAKEGLTVRVKQSSIVRGAVRDITQAFIADFEDATIYDGDQLQEAVDKAIDHWEIDDKQQQQEELDATQDDGTDAEPNAEDFGTHPDLKQNGH